MHQYIKLKTGIYFVLCILFLNAIAFGQVNFGIKAAINSSTTILEGKALPYLIGFNAGFISNIPLSSHFFISPQLLFSSKGNGQYDDNRFRLTYLSLPVQVGYKIIRQLDILLGPEFSYLLNAVVTDGAHSTSYKDGYRTIDLGLDASARFNINKKWGIDFSYVLGLRGISIPNQPYAILANGVVVQSGTIPISEKDNSKNQSFQLGVFFFID
jgi:hypothetical protein